MERSKLNHLPSQAGKILDEDKAREMASVEDTHRFVERSHPDVLSQSNISPEDMRDRGELMAEMKGELWDYEHRAEQLKDQGDIETLQKEIEQFEAQLLAHEEKNNLLKVDRSSSGIDFEFDDALSDLKESPEQTNENVALRLALEKRRIARKMLEGNS